MDVNEPIKCLGCGCDRFFELVQVNATTCRIPEDDVHRRQIRCANCGATYEDVSWEWKRVLGGGDGR